ncbi:hypothetical protein [Pseudomonas sp. MWU13-3659]|uniref:hypothetical protein n=1 Tax=Pseudomonas sp. MWU13-3659 TaxID=2986964 RepID=UPI0020758EB4|nr:hypothetical protein [Pseudomonas sp. MWU13-3659]
MKNLSKDNCAMWLQAGNQFTAQSLTSEFHEIITWAPSLKRSGEDYYIPRKNIPENVWMAMHEIEDWGMAERLDSPKGEVFIVDASLLDLIMKTIQLLLEILYQPKETNAITGNPRLTYDTPSTLG